MLVASLTTQPRHQSCEEKIIKFYREIDITEKMVDSVGRISKVDFGVYDYSKKNKFVNNTELEQNNGRAQRDSQ